MKRTCYVGAWKVNLHAGWIEARRRWLARRRYPDARLMAVLELLIQHAGRTVSVERILEAAWPNRVVGRDSVSTAIYQLRQLLGDDSHRPRYIRTDGRRGYRLIESVSAADPTAHRVRLAAIAATLATGILLTLLPLATRSPPLLVEALQDRSQGAVSSPLPDAIGSTLLSELAIRMPGQIVQRSSGEPVQIALRSQLVACDLGPALVVHLLDTRDERYLWSNAYSLEEYQRKTEGLSLVQTAANDIRAAFSAL